MHLGRGTPATLALGRQHVCACTNRLQPLPATQARPLTSRPSMQGGIQRASWSNHSGHLGVQTISQETLPHRAQLIDQAPLPSASSEGQQPAIRAQRQLIKPQHSWEATLTLVSPARPPLPHRTPVAAPRAAHCGRLEHLARESRHSASCPRQGWPCWLSGTCSLVANPARKVTLQLHSWRQHAGPCRPCSRRHAVSHREISQGSLQMALQVAVQRGFLWSSRKRGDSLLC